MVRTKLVGVVLALVWIGCGGDNHAVTKDAPTAHDGPAKDAPASPKELTAFAFVTSNNPALAADVVATIAGTSIHATVPFETNVTQLVATFTTTGASVTVAGAAQTSGVTANDFSSPVTYTVHGSDGTTADYTVTAAPAMGVATLVPVTGFTALIDAVPSSDGSTFYLLATTASGPAVLSTTSAGGAATALATGAPLLAPTSIAISTDNNTLYIASPTDGANGIIWTLPASGGTPTALAGTSGFRPNGLCVVGTTLYFTGASATTAQPGVFSVPTSGGAVTPIAIGPPFRVPSGVAVRGNGDVLVADTPSASQPSAILRVSSGSTSVFYSALAAATPIGLAVDAANDSVWAADVDSMTHDMAFRISFASGTAYADTTGLGTASMPRGLHRASNAEIFAYADATGLFVIDVR